MPNGQANITLSISAGYGWIPIISTCFAILVVLTQFRLRLVMILKATAGSIALWN